MESLITEIERSYDEVQRRMNQPGVYDDPARASELGREYKRLEISNALAQRWRGLRAQLDEGEALLGDEDPEIREMARAQRADAEAALPAVEEELRRSMVEPDPNDHRNVILEIRSGAGGDEAALWAGDLLDMYVRFARSHGLQVEELSLHHSDAGGYSEAVIAIKGDGAYSLLKWESGVHRVQRVPATEAQGRIHTSTASVVVRPELDDVEVDVDMNDVRVDVFRSSGPGGQSVNTTDSAVRLTHVPTGIVVSCQNEKSQHQNKDQALRVLRTRLYELELERRAAELGETRRSAIGTGDRAEKIRTYNFAEKRVTDHRIKLTLYRYVQILQGDLDELVTALQQAEMTSRLEERFGGSAIGAFTGRGAGGGA